MKIPAHLKHKPIIQVRIMIALMDHMPTTLMQWGYLLVSHNGTPRDGQSFRQRFGEIPARSGPVDQASATERGS